jgi:hypothetical protein
MLLFFWPVSFHISLQILALESLKVGSLRFAGDRDNAHEKLICHEKRVLF